MTVSSDHKETSPLERLARLGERFQGVSLKFRREGTGWPWEWEAECFSCKHDVARIKCFGATAESAIDALVKAVKERMGD